MNEYQKPVIYQLVVRYFSNTNTTNKQNGSIAENGCGKFNDINGEGISELKKLGVTHIWLTGILRQSTLIDYSSFGMPADVPDIVKGLAGSFYAVRDYFDVCPDYALDPSKRMDEFQDLVQRIHDAKIKVLIDFVPNHVSRNYHSIIKPEWDFGKRDDQTRFFDPGNNFFYLVEPSGQRLHLEKPDHWNPPGITFHGHFSPEDGSLGHVPRVTGDNVTSPSPSMNNWYETVKLNYGFNFVTGEKQFQPIPLTWEIVDHIFAYWQEKGIDGFRCDFAHYVPEEAWQYFIDKARKRNPKVFFMAEAYPWPGSKDPIESMGQLIDAGFEAVYFDKAYDTLKKIYQGSGTLDDYSNLLGSLSSGQRPRYVMYLENHDERRIASPIEQNVSPESSGFGSMEAGYQLAPLQFLYSRGPVLLYNGQETGEPGAGNSGFSINNGKTTFFDYWAMPEFAKWVNNHTYDGSGLSDRQVKLRRFYADLLALCQDPSVCGDSYWGLRYYNRYSRFQDCPDALYSFARFQSQSRRLLVVVANFGLNGTETGKIRIPEELVDHVLLGVGLTVRLIFNENGQTDGQPVALSRSALIGHGFSATVSNQACNVYAIE